ncbi:hypothetical protein HU720_01955 [Pseudomonas sp. SWRI51]|uniref:hypothetical protein n=1 Tax=Pseudomonas sp. SWRI51 TaxID=2745491 RepID=UPI00164431D3|nr:hypothetical protein [Pseudomonas sp. SWRI51]MBC3410068.1 hypothetical protein [Pseudomonas sp. SWRI51]
MTASAAQRGALLNILRIKVEKIGKGERRYIDRREENARAYAEALADANIITDDERDELYEKAQKAAEDSVRMHRAAGEPHADRYLWLREHAVRIQGSDTWYQGAALDIRVDVGRDRMVEQAKQVHEGKVLLRHQPE